MPSVRLLPPSASGEKRTGNPLPSLLHTPSGLAVVELQGSILTEDSNTGASAALDLGKLVFPAADEHAEDGGGEWDGKRVFLLVGHHQRLTGEVKKLAKPLGLLRRKHVSGSVTSANEDEVDIAEVIYYKIQFSHRPEPVGATAVLHDE